MVQLQQQLADMAAQLAEAKSGNDVKLEIEKMRGETAKDVAELNGMVQLLVRNMSMPALTQDVMQDLAEDDQQQAPQPMLQQPMPTPTPMPAPQAIQPQPMDE